MIENKRFSQLIDTVISGRLPALVIFYNNKKKTSTDNPHPKTKEIRELTKLSAQAITLSFFSKVKL